MLLRLTITLLNDCCQLGSLDKDYLHSVAYSVRFEEREGNYGCLSRKNHVALITLRSYKLRNDLILISARNNNMQQLTQQDLVSLLVMYTGGRQRFRIQRPTPNFAIAINQQLY